MENQLPTFKRIPDHAIAKLLGLSLEEYHNLNHLPLEAETDSTGEVIGFKMRVSSGNSQNLLSKLNVDKNFIVKLRPEQVYRYYG